MPKSPISQATVANIFRHLRGRFGSPFVDRYRSGKIVPDGQPNAGKDTGLLEAMDVWAHELAGLTVADIEHGLNSKFKFPPSCDEFVQACLQRDYSAQPHNTVPALPPARITELDRQAAQKHMAKVSSAVRGMGFPAGNQKRLDWAMTIAGEVERKNYHGGSYGARMAAEALLDARKPIPAALIPFLPAVKREELEGDHEQYREAA